MTKSQIPNSKQIPSANNQMTQTMQVFACFGFRIWVIEIYLGFGAWDLVLSFGINANPHA
jgi:hypothetical protein